MAHEWGAGDYEVISEVSGDEEEERKKTHPGPPPPPPPAPQPLSQPHARVLDGLLAGLQQRAQQHSTAQAAASTAAVAVPASGRPARPLMPTALRQSQPDSQGRRPRLLLQPAPHNTIQPTVGPTNDRAAGTKHVRPSAAAAHAPPSLLATLFPSPEVTQCQKPEEQVAPGTAVMTWALGGTATPMPPMPPASPAAAAAAAADDAEKGVVEMPLAAASSARRFDWKQQRHRGPPPALHQPVPPEPSSHPEHRKPRGLHDPQHQLQQQPPLAQQQRQQQPQQPQQQQQLQQRRPQLVDRGRYLMRPPAPPAPPAATVQPEAASAPESHHALAVSLAPGSRTAVPPGPGHSPAAMAAVAAATADVATMARVVAPAAETAGAPVAAPAAKAEVAAARGDGSLPAEVAAGTGDARFAIEGAPVSGMGADVEVEAEEGAECSVDFNTYLPDDVATAYKQ